MNDNQETAAPVDFDVETNRQHGLVYYTPLTYAAYDWSQINLQGLPMHGQSYILAAANPRSQKLRGFLKGAEFVVCEKQMPRLDHKKAG